MPPPTALPIQMQSWSKTRTIAPYSRECLARGGRRTSERSSNSEGVDCPSGKASTADQYAPCSVSSPPATNPGSAVTSEMYAATKHASVRRERAARVGASRSA